MYFPWKSYEEQKLSRRNTLQVFITNVCNLKCDGCFARNVMIGNTHMGLNEYEEIIRKFLNKGGQQINILGGEPLLHPDLRGILRINKTLKIKTTIYTNGVWLSKYTPQDFEGVKLRVSIYTVVITDFLQII